MLNLNISKSQPSNQILLPNYKPFILSRGNAFFANTQFKPVRKHTNVWAARGSSNIKAVQTLTDKSTTTTNATAIITVQQTVGDFLTHLGLSEGFDYVDDHFLGKPVLLIELVAAELDPNTGLEKPKIKASAHKKDKDGDETHYECNFNVPKDFGEVGAITIENEHHVEMFVESIVIDRLYGGSINVTCNY